jgi:hypothetical protein
VLVDQWKSLGSQLPANWRSAELSLRLEDAKECDTAAHLLAPAQPFRPEQGLLRFSVARDGTAPSPDGIQRLLRLVDRLRLHGKLAIVSTATRDVPVAVEQDSLATQWAQLEATLPTDWSHALAELELESTDYVEPASLYCTPLNLRREGTSARLRFRAARTFGYGGSPEMVRRCLERCDEHDIKGRLRILDLASSVDSVGTQGPLLTAGPAT